MILVASFHLRIFSDSDLNQLLSFLRTPQMLCTGRFKKDKSCCRKGKGSTSSPQTFLLTPDRFTWSWKCLQVHFLRSRWEKLQLCTCSYLF